MKGTQSHVYYYNMVSTSCQHSIRLEFSSGLPLSPLGQNPMLLGIQEHSQPPPDQHKLHSLLLNPIPYGLLTNLTLRAPFIMKNK